MADGDKGVAKSEATGLTDGQKVYAAELMARVVQNVATVDDWNKLRRFREKDPYHFIGTILDGAMTHPDFFIEGNTVDNLHKNAIIRLKLEETKSKTSLNAKRDDVMSIDAINKLRSLGGHPKDSVPKTRIVDVSEKVEHTGEKHRVSDDDAS